MRTRFWAAALSVVGLISMCAALVGLRAAGVITQSPLPLSDYPSPIGIDWISTSNRLLISTYYDTGLPYNFETVDRGTGAHVQWGVQSGWENEIYFATVRPGQPGGWVEGDVFSAKGFVDRSHIAQFDSTGAPVNLNFATLPGEAKLKRGGMTFDRYGVPGLNGALLVLASNATSLEGGGYTVWKVDVSGIAQKVIDLPGGGHGEGIVVVPNDPAYGPWAGKILVGKEETSELDVIDPLTQSRVTMPVPVGIEDIWVIPPNSDFYGVDHDNQQIWTTPASDWASAGLVGKVLFAQEHPARLFVASWNGSSFDFADITVPGPTDWEHITFVPVIGTPGLTIKKYTNGSDANDPNASGVPNIAPGGTVTWTYVVTNTGSVSVPRAQVSVTDNTTGVTPTFSSEMSGNGDTIFNPGEVWLYTATGTALDLTLPPPPGVHTVANSCTAGGTQPPRTAYTNVGTATIPGASATDPSSYCNPPVPGVTIVKYTNGQDANDPNGAGVPNVAPGGTVTWTYKVTNTGQTSVPKAQVSVTDNTTGVTPTFTSELSGNGDGNFDPGEVWLYTATGTALDLTLPPPAGVHTVPNSCTAGGSQPQRTAYTNVGTVTIQGASATDPSSYCNPPSNGKSISIGPSSMEGAIKIDAGDWVNGGYSFKTNFTGNITIAATVSITGKCIGGSLPSDTVTVDLGSIAYAAVAGSDWKPTGDANSILSWQGSVVAPSTLCGGGGGQLDASKGAVFKATISGAPSGGLVTFRFKFRDPAAKGKPNTNCLNASDPNRNKADVCGASWSATKVDP